MPDRWSCAIVVALLWCISSPALNGQSPDGMWRSEGYGLYFDVAGATLTAYEVTSISCLRSFTANRTGTDSAGNVTFAVVDRETTFLFRSGGTPDRRILHMNGAASDIVLHR